MDEGRKRDIARLTEVVNDCTKSKATRRWADKARKNIVRQLKDPTLRRMRERLIKASQNRDEHVELKLMNQIKSYQKQEKIEV